MKKSFPSPCGVWIVSTVGTLTSTKCMACFRPLAGKVFRIAEEIEAIYNGFPSPCGVWVVSPKIHGMGKRTGVSVP